MQKCTWAFYFAQNLDGEGMTLQSNPDPNPVDNIDGIGEEQEVDWKTRYEEAEQARIAAEKEANDARSQRIGTLKQYDRDELLASTTTRVSSIDHRIGGLEKAIGVVLEATLNGDTQAAQEKFQRIQQETQQSLSNMDWETYRQDRLDAVRALISDADGQPLVNLESPEMQPLVNTLNDAADRRDRAGIESGISELKDIIYQKRLEAFQNGAAKAPEPKPEEDQDSSEGDLLSTMDAGNTSGGRGVFSSPDQIRTAFLMNRIDAKRRDELMRQFNR